MRERTRWYIDHGISEERYQELKWFSRQYRQLKQAAQSFARGETDRMPGSGAYHPNDPTARDAVCLADGCPEGRKAALIERAAKLAAQDISAWILRNVTEGLTYEQLCPPCGKRKFFDARRKYFVVLNKLT